MGDPREFQTVVLAALLHDAGKYLQRGRSLAFDIGGTHPEVSLRLRARGVQRRQGINTGGGRRLTLFTHLLTGSRLQRQSRRSEDTRIHCHDTLHLMLQANISGLAHQAVSIAGERPLQQRTC